ncbi:DUF58 domain-containing protein [Croceivirga sp. JEA036]|uniref:DUF58 domain-containing protein n=1 Tax=Croceivirga sp. JEA036 TaxID=2721162 RepID=UPI00143AE4D4|nr:DUF58 domain-containing protein [Croceivirga sp. JEA036]NJB36332.1 DUF58 domain-containing protein [Croceivirga sp. JEA036]
MDIKNQLQGAKLFKNLELLAKYVVEGFINGMHKSPFHGFSSEFAEHKIYNNGESTKHIDWKLFARTDKLYTKRYEEETNLRCHMILDNSASMYFPKLKQQQIGNLNKMGFSVLAIAALMNLLKKQRDAVGLSIYGQGYNYYAPEKSSERHMHMLLDQLNTVVNTIEGDRETQTYVYLHQIAEKLHRRSLVFLFTDMLQIQVTQEKLFEGLRHLKYNKHDVVLFHVLNKKLEQQFDFEDGPKQFVDVETGQKIDVYAEGVKENYKKEIAAYTEAIKLKCMQYKIKYVAVDVDSDFATVLNTFLVERRNFV